MILHKSRRKPETELEAALSRRLGGEVLFDSYSRHLYSTDASMYSVEPIGVVYPRDADDVAATVEIAAEHGSPVLPRGGGTSLAGQTVGQAVVLDFSRYMNAILEVDPESLTARVQPGVVQDDLNRAVLPHRLLFAPDTSTSNRATIGGMIGNNSCGARSARYGMTIDHIDSLRVVLSDGSRASFGAVDEATVAARANGSSLEAGIYREISSLLAGRADVIRRDMPPHWRRSGGYRLERMLPESGPFSLANLVVGSEGTLAITTEATVKLVRKPPVVAALVGHFETVSAAIAAAHPAMEVGASAVELVDRIILSLARRSPIHRHLAEQLHGDPGAILWVEFYGDTLAEASEGMERLLERWKREGHGYALVPAPTPAEQKGFVALRKAGQGLLLAAGQNGERSLAFVEDTAVPPEKLAEYAERFASVLEQHQMHAGFYGHASAGCLHIRPYLDLTRPGSVERMRTVSEAVVDLVAEYGGMNSSEHGDGLVRSEFNRRIFGDELYGTMQEVKRIFDPENRMNPGKKVDPPPMTENLRDPALPPAPAFDTHFHYQFADGMRGLANRCMRIGECRKSPASGGVMCPSYMATREEEHSTRGRANALVRALSMPNPAEELGSDDRLHEILDLCLECKACKRECPMSVDMATMKSEALAARHAKYGIPLRSRVFGHVRTLNRIGAAFAPLSNLGTDVAPARKLLERVLGIHHARPLPRFQRQTLTRWFAGRRRRKGASSAVPSKGPLVFLADSFTSYTEPEIGRAAIVLLEAAGWEVELVNDVCCGRSLISKGLLDDARKNHEALVGKLGPRAEQGVPIVGVEPSCVLTLREELPDLMGRSAGVDAIASRATLADDLIADAVADGSLDVDPDAEIANRPILFHGHCHQKAGGAVAGSVRVLQSIPGAQVDVIDAGCCGMAGSFGFEAEHYDLSMQIGGQRLFPAVKEATSDALIAATGVSCRQQIAHGAGRGAQHPIVLLRSATRIP